MKKIIKLTESQLYNMITKSLNEQNNLKLPKDFGNLTSTNTNAWQQSVNKQKQSNPAKAADMNAMDRKAKEKSAINISLPDISKKELPKPQSPIITTDGKNQINFYPDNIKSIQSGLKGLNTWDKSFDKTTSDSIDKLLSASVSGYYDSNVKNAVKLFQQAKGYQVTGYVNKKMASELNRINNTDEIQTMFSLNSVQPKPVADTKAETSKPNTEFNLGNNNTEKLLTTPDPKLINPAYKAPQSQYKTNAPENPYANPYARESRDAQLDNLQADRKLKKEKRSVNESIKRILRDYTQKK